MMRTRVAILVVALSGIIGYALHALAQPRLDVRATLTPITSSASNGVSFAWFYDAGTRTVVLCRAASGPKDPVDCKAQTTLP